MPIKEHRLVVLEYKTARSRPKETSATVLANWEVELVAFARAHPTELKISLRELVLNTAMSLACRAHPGGEERDALEREIVSLWSKRLEL